jgi:hypothetical protein
VPSGKPYGGVLYVAKVLLIVYVMVTALIVFLFRRMTLKSKSDAKLLDQKDGEKGAPPVPAKGAVQAIPSDAQTVFVPPPNVKNAKKAGK